MSACDMKMIICWTKALNVVGGSKKNVVGGSSKMQGRDSFAINLYS